MDKQKTAITQLSIQYKYNNKKYNNKNTAMLNAEDNRYWEGVL